ncbi:MAG TPA: hypothetical protein VLJ88_02975, partial [Propionibacteriaceae bacterium]|nr:hypothetical protein [Propionibacteriaceae bacterium]
MLLALLASSSTAPAQADPVGAKNGLAVECPEAVPAADVTGGMIGQGLTVVRGSSPEPFQVEVLGVLDDGIGAGRDMVIINVSDVPGGHVIDQGGGSWSGISGSPVYVDGKLLGSVSWGFTAAPSTIGGLTLAADMLELLDLPTAAAVQAKRAAAKRTSVKLSAAARRDLAAKAGVATPRGTLQRLDIPLAIGGLGPKRIQRLQSDLNAAGRSVRAYAAGRVAAPKANAVPDARPEAGGNFAAMLSYGDVTAGYVGTTTTVCGDQALAFGHFLDMLGPVSYGANDAAAVAIVKDDTFGSYKMANIGVNLGTVDQDRSVGVRANLTETPTGTNVTTILRNLDTGKQRTGTTTVIDQASLPGLLVGAVFANQDAVFDEWADGTARSDWTITGRRAGNVPFAVSRSNLWASLGDVTIDPAEDIAFAADALLNNEFEDVTIDNVTFGSDMATKFQQLHITKLEVARPGGKYTTARSLPVRAGERIKVRVSTR